MGKPSKIGSLRSPPKRFAGLWSERAFIILCWSSALLVTGALCCILGFVCMRAWPVLNLQLLFGAVPPLEALLGQSPVWEGIWPACLGTILITLLSAGLALPLGIAGGIYLAEYAKSPWKNIFRFIFDLLAGIPSIVIGLFGFSLILFLKRSFWPGADTCLLLAGTSIAVLVLPYSINATQNAFASLPASIKILGPSLGFGEWQSLRYILFPAAGRGILNGVILTLGRAAEDTAVILLTGVVASTAQPSSVFDKFEALPFFIYYTAAQHQNKAELDRGFGAALILVILTGTLFVGALWLQRSLERRWKTPALT